jgi:hypothetical protein
VPQKCNNITTVIPWKKKKYGFISNNLRVSKNKNKNKTKIVKDRMKKLRVNKRDLHPS